MYDPAENREFLGLRSALFRWNSASIISVVPFP